MTSNAAQLVGLRFGTTRKKTGGTFLRQVRWFSSNHDQQFGRLLTPLVDGVRVRGPFQPTAIELQNNHRQLVLLDGEGLGHSAKEATSVSTKVTEKFVEVDMILLVDTSQSPLQAAFFGTASVSGQQRTWAQTRRRLHSLRPSKGRQSWQLCQEAEPRSRVN